MTDHALLMGLDDGDRERILAAAVRREYARGEVLVREGDPSHTLHLIDRGRVGTPDGDIATLAILGPGECFGELTLTRPESVRTATVEAVEPVVTITIGRADFDELRRSRPSVDRFIVAVLAAQVTRLTNLALEALYLPAETRLVHRLRDLHDAYEGGGGATVIPLTQAEIATMAGTTRPTANQVLKRLEADGALTVERGRIVIHDPTRLDDG